MNQRYEGLTNPGMMIAFISAVFGFLSFADTFFFLGQDSVFAMGLIRLVLGFIYFIEAMVNLLKGRGSGNLNLIFSVCFGLFSGSNILITTVQSSYVALEQPPIYGILQIFAAAFLLCILPVMKKIPFYQWLCFCCAIGGLMGFGLHDLTRILLLKKLGGLFFLGFGLLNIYTGLSAVIPELWQGHLMEEVFKSKKA